MKWRIKGMHLITYLERNKAYYYFINFIIFVMWETMLIL